MFARFVGDAQVYSEFWDSLHEEGLLTPAQVSAARARHESAGGAVDTAVLEARALGQPGRAHLARLLARAADCARSWDEVAVTPLRRIRRTPAG